MARAQLQTLVDGGLSYSAALRAVIETRYGGLAEWSRRRAFHRSHVTHLVNGTARSRMAKVRRALARDLGWTVRDLDWWLDRIRAERDEREQ